MCSDSCCIRLPKMAKDDLRSRAGENDRSLNWHRADLIQEEELARKPAFVGITTILVK